MFKIFQIEIPGFNSVDWLIFRILDQMESDRPQEKSNIQLCDRVKVLQQCTITKI